jgi:enhancing lycopene biosynthesis protein 2
MFNQVYRSSLRHQAKMPILAQQLRFASYSYRAAVLLHGNGANDGTETTEAVAALVGLSRAKAQIQCFAPNRNQMHVVDHSTGEEDNSHTRNMLVESARISRGNVKDISELCASDFDAIIIPGGFGVAKNLSDYGSAGDKMVV